ncbi:MAG: hypothetical protein CVU11_10145 [Bacteroidetes bacterium HGW-Bacteroidetes-6]|jgi:hypothetical protein|nr:MAG: hypothetical protein CVU11_10145 [Bacteroidetes bacterium HGW-Bacteroidetes-6]
MDKIDYNTLNAKQKESYNYQMISAVLAEYGYTTYRMHDDYHGADFHAVHVDGHVLKVQLKSRITIHYKYLNKDIFIAFSNDRIKWYLYPHDEIFEIVTNHSGGAKDGGHRSIHYIPKWLMPFISKFEL